VDLKGWVAAAPDAPDHDLQLLAEQVRREYFRDVPALPIRWGHRISRKRRSSIRLGSYDHRTREIRIHPSLNVAWVPPFFVQSIIHHEYLHHILGAPHDRRFRAFERRFRFHRQSHRWLKRNLSTLLGRRPQRATAPEGVHRPLVRQQQLALF
jgi:hypothetical protein